MQKPSKPTPDFPLFPHACGSWAKKIGGKLKYYGPWNDPQGALARYLGSEPINVPLAPPTSNKPTRPRGFPLSAHANGQWAKRVRGKLHYFGRWDQPKAALEKWLEEKDALLAGRRPTSQRGGLTVGGLIDHFLTNRKNRVESGELRERTLRDYKAIAEQNLKTFGRERLVESLGPDDFADLKNAFAKRHGLVALTVDITKSRVIWKYADTTFRVRVHYGDSFNAPTKSALRRERNSKPKKLFKAAEIHAIFQEASIPLRAMILLGINCGFGNDDCATLRITDLDLDGGWHNFARPKTGIDRRCPLWPETVEALRAALKVRPKPRDPALSDRVFITKQRNSWAIGLTHDSPISKEMTTILKKLGLKQLGRNFYSLRHTFQTIGDGSGQMFAVQYIMGHAPATDNMAAIYREHTFEHNLIAVSNYVRDWFKGAEKTSPRPEPTQPDKSVSVVEARLKLYVDPETREEPIPRRDTSPSRRRGSRR